MALSQQPQESPLYKQPCRNTPEDRQSDLCAQWKAVDWTKMGTIVAIFGTIALLFQIRLGWEAVKDTGKATKAMHEANEIARESMEKQLRAYLDFDGVRWLRDEKRDAADRVRCGVQVCVRNYGHTPANGVVFGVRYSMRGGEGSNVRPLAEDPGSNNFEMIAPQDHATKNGLFDIPPAIWALIGDDKLTFITHVHVKYADAFGRPHSLSSDFESQGHGDMTFVDGSRKGD